MGRHTPKIMMDVVLVRNANQTVTTANLSDEGIELRFADGFKGLIPYADVPEGQEMQGSIRSGPAQPL